MHFMLPTSIQSFEFACGLVSKLYYSSHYVCIYKFSFWFGLQVSPLELGNGRMQKLQLFIFDVQIYEFCHVFSTIVRPLERARCHTENIICHGWSLWK